MALYSQQDAPKCRTAQTPKQLIGVPEKNEGGGEAEIICFKRDTSFM